MNLMSSTLGLMIVNSRKSVNAVIGYEIWGVAGDRFFILRIVMLVSRYVNFRKSAAGRGFSILLREPLVFPE